MENVYGDGGCVTGPPKLKSLVGNVSPVCLSSLDFIGGGFCHRHQSYHLQTPTTPIFDPYPAPVNCSDSRYQDFPLFRYISSSSGNYTGGSSLGREGSFFLSRPLSAIENFDKAPRRKRPVPVKPEEQVLVMDELPVDSSNSHTAKSGAGGRMKITLSSSDHDRRLQHSQSSSSTVRSEESNTGRFGSKSQFAQGTGKCEPGPSSKARNKVKEAPPPPPPPPKPWEKEPPPRSAWKQLTVPPTPPSSDEYPPLSGLSKTKPPLPRKPSPTLSSTEAPPPPKSSTPLSSTAAPFNPETTSANNDGVKATSPSDSREKAPSACKEEVNSEIETVLPALQSVEAPSESKAKPQPSPAPPSMEASPTAPKPSTPLSCTAAPGSSTGTTSANNDHCLPLDDVIKATSHSDSIEKAPSKPKEEVNSEIEPVIQALPSVEAPSESKDKPPFSETASQALPSTEAPSAPKDLTPLSSTVAPYEPGAGSSSADTASANNDSSSLDHGIDTTSPDDSSDKALSKSNEEVNPEIEQVSQAQTSSVEAPSAETAPQTPPSTTEAPSASRASQPLSTTAGAYEPGGGGSSSSSASTASAYNDWSPQDDGIQCDPSEEAPSRSREEVDAEIEAVLYGPVKKRLQACIEAEHERIVWNPV